MVHGGGYGYSGFERRLALCVKEASASLHFTTQYEYSSVCS